MSNSGIRPIAIGVFRQGDKILVLEGHDTVKNEIFYRPLGGGIEFREFGIDALRREIREEISAEICNVAYLATFENIFIHQGQPLHEIMLVYNADFIDRSIYQAKEIMGQENDGSPLRVLWKPLSDFRNNGSILYPAGLLNLFAKNNPDK